MQLTKPEPFSRARFGKYMTKTIDRYRDSGLPYDHPLMDMLDREFNGGECPKCKAPWKQIDVSNTAAVFSYYDPTCKCYTRCPVCRTSLHREEMTGGRAHRCGSCGWDVNMRPVHEVECDDCHRWFSSPRQRKNNSPVDEMDNRYQKMICPSCASGGNKRRSKGHPRRD